MAIESIIDDVAAKQGWNDDTIRALLVEYVDNQGDDACFEDFLRQRAADENEECGA